MLCSLFFFLKDGLIRSLLQASVLVLSFFNVVYSGALSVVLIYDLAYLRSHDLMRSFSIGEIFADGYATLLDWLQTYTTIIFSVRQLAWPCMFWHCYIAYIFLQTTRGKTPVSAIQRSFPYAILGVSLMTGLSVALEACSYKGLLPMKPLVTEIILSAICVSFVLCTYVATCTVLLRRTSYNAPDRVANTPYVTKTRNAILGKMLMVLAAFILVWTWVIANATKVDVYI